jgi:hypothetical protein
MRTFCVTGAQAIGLSFRGAGRQRGNRANATDTPVTGITTADTLAAAADAEITTAAASGLKLPGTAFHRCLFPCAAP